MSPTPPRHVYLVDGSGFIFRAFHGLPPMTRADGTPVNAVYGFTQMLLRLLQDTDADHVAVIFDHARKTFRSDIYPQYKAQRPPPPEELVPQFALIREAVEAFNVASVAMEGFEADDLIATYARQAAELGAEVTIVSSDKDLMQLVDDRITLFDAMKNRVIGRDQVFEKFGVAPDRVVDVQALAGDSSDNVPGVEGIGVKTAAQLIDEYGDLETLLARASEIKQPKRRERLLEQADMARISRQLVQLKEDVPVERPLSDFAVRKPNVDAVCAFLEAQDFKSLITRIRGRLTAANSPNGAQAEAVAAEVAPQTIDYELVQDEAALRRWIDEARHVGVVAVDTETTSLNAMRAELVGVSLSVTAGRACYIPLGHKGAGKPQGAFDFGGDDGGATDDSAPRQIPIKAALALLKPLLEDPGVLKVGQNLKYDMLVLSRLGIQIAPIDDTMVLSYVLEGGAHGHGMDELADLHLGYKTIKFADVAGSGKTAVTFDRVDLEKARDYAAEDADVTGRLYRLLKPRLIAEKLVTVYETLERPLIPILVEMERTGIKVDAKVLIGLSSDFETRLAALEKDIHAIAGKEFNVGSPKQLGEILFDEMGVTGGKKGKTGAYGTGADILEDIANGEDNDTAAKLAQAVLDWRQIAKLKSTYTDALVRDIHPQTGRVHTSYAMAATSTGRLASSDPNLQNIPIRSEEGRKIRQAFIAEKGCKLVSADYSQIELRLLAHVAGIEALKTAFHNDQDIHALTASQVFGVPLEGMDSNTRRKAKAINFGIIYGISAFGLARQLGIGRSEAAQYIDAYFQQYPGIRAYMDTTKKQAREQGYVTTLFGRKCHLRGINDRNPNVKGFAERAAINAPIQGGAADIIKRAMVALPDALAEAGLAAKMLLQVHDELIFEVPEAEVEKTRALVKQVMEAAADLSVPLVVDVGIGNTWDEAH